MWMTGFCVIWLTWMALVDCSKSSLALEPDVLCNTKSIQPRTEAFSETVP